MQGIIGNFKRPNNHHFQASCQQPEAVPTPEPVQIEVVAAGITLQKHVIVMFQLESLAVFNPALVTMYILFQLKEYTVIRGIWQVCQSASHH